MKNGFIKKDYSQDHIIKIVLSLGSESYKRGTNGEFVFQTVCHNNENGSYKLYYYPDSHLFHCYTDCGDSFDIYDLVSRARKCTFYQSYIYINKLLDIKETHREGFHSDKLDDWDIIKKYGIKKEKQKVQNIRVLPNSLIDYYYHINPVEWEEEGISHNTIIKYKIRYDLTNNKIVIPHFNEEGQLIGIRGRSLNIEDIEQGKKYMPMILEGNIFRHPTAFNLYGLHNNKGAIKASKKIMLFEAEKSVLKCDGYYGDKNFTVACCGSNISAYQRDLIISLGVKEVFIAFDKEYHAAFSEESDIYSEKILSLAYKFSPYITTYVLWDTKNLLNYKDAPCDRGKETLEELMKYKFEVTTQEE